MHLRKNQEIQIAPGFQDAGRKGIHLLTLEIHGRTWHVVQLKGEKAPTLQILGSIVAQRRANLNKSLQAVIDPYQNTIPISPT